MREFNSYGTDALNANIRIEAADDPDANGVHHKYNYLVKHHGQWQKAGSLVFQAGPLEERGPNGVSNEALLSIVLDRLQTFRVKIAGRENAVAITKLEECLHWLRAREEGGRCGR